jgi:Family of unknown function (DUF6228)
VSEVQLSDGRITISFANPIGSGGAVELLTIGVRGPELIVSRQVYEGWTHGFAGLVAYFAQLVDSWRGWEGERIYESCEHDFRLIATHDGHVNLSVLLWESAQPRGWRVEASLRIEPGEQLSQVARDLSALIEPLV